MTLSADDARSFHRDGVVVLRGFYDLEREIEPICDGIRRVIDLAREGLGMQKRGDGPFDGGYGELVREARAVAGRVYDGVKQLPAFVRLVSSERHEQVFEALRGPRLGGVAQAARRPPRPRRRRRGP